MTTQIWPPQFSNSRWCQATVLCCHQAVLDKKAELDAEDEDEDDEDDDVDFDGDVDGVDIDQLDLDPTPLEVPLEANDVFDHVEFEEPDPLDP